MTSSSIAAVITAGGSGQRMGQALPKQFHLLAGVPILIHTLRVFRQVPMVAEILLVVPADHCQATAQMLADFELAAGCRVVAGGDSRQESVRRGLEQVGEAVEFVVVHDGVRPLVTPAIVEACIQAARADGAAMAAVPVKDTLKAVAADQLVARTVDRTGLWQAQTPQVARRDWLQEAYRVAAASRFLTTDEAALLENIGRPVRVVLGAERNLKITRPEDLAMAEAILAQEAGPRNTGAGPRVGHGYDAHRLVAERPLVLGGVVIPHPLGLLGHSDADVLCHALCDALLGAIGAGDIGRHFPDRDPQYKGISSLKLLARVIELVAAQGFALANADLTVVAQQPKLVPHFPAMLANLSQVCRVEASAINLKATTTEGMGFSGRQEGIGCHAVVMVSPK